MEGSQCRELEELPWHYEPMEYGDMYDSDDEEWGRFGSDSEDEDVDRELMVGNKGTLWTIISESNEYVF